MGEEKHEMLTGGKSVIKLLRASIQYNQLTINSFLKLMPLSITYIYYPSF
jgi:hypothetical protein